MAIVQNSKIKVRSGLQQNLPQLDQGEFGWSVDTQRLFIGNGTVANGAPLAGNTEIFTVVSAQQLTRYVPVSGTFQQTPNGNITQFWTAGNVSPIPATMIVWNETPLIPNIGYTQSGFIVNFVSAPLSNSNLYWQGWVSQ